MTKRRILTEREAREEQLKLHPYLKPTPTTTQVTMVIPGARVYGEDWVEVRVGHDGDNIVVNREATEAPASGRPVFAVSGPDAEYTRHILAAAAEKAAGRQVSEMSYEEKFAIVNAAWHDWLEQKKRALRGISTFGLGGSNQRQRVYQNPDTRPMRSN